MPWRLQATSFLSLADQVPSFTPSGDCGSEAGAMPAGAGVDDDRLLSNIPSSMDVEALEQWFSIVGINGGDVRSSLTGTSGDSIISCSAS